MGIRDSCDALDEKNGRVELDDRAEKLGYRMREGQIQKVPYLLVIGDKEAESGDVAVRSRAGDEGVMTLDAFLARIGEEVRTKKIDL